MPLATSKKTKETFFSFFFLLLNIWISNLLVILRYSVETGAIVRVSRQSLGRRRRARVSIRHASVTRRSVLVRRRTSVHRLLSTLSSWIQDEDMEKYLKTRRKKHQTEFIFKVLQLSLNVRGTLIGCGSTGSCKSTRKLETRKPSATTVRTVTWIFKS